MPKRLAVTTLNASTIDILNVIRQNAPYDYQQAVPKVEKATDIPKVGEIIYGTPALANTFIYSLVNRIALVRVNSATFNNPYAILKKGYIEFGESIEEIFVQIAKVVQYDPEKAPAREFRRTLPDVESVFYAINWKVMYPVTIQDEDLRQAFLSMEGVQNLIAKIVDSVYTAAEYDEFLLFKYLIIKSVTAGKLFPEPVDTSTDFRQAAVVFRAMSNLMMFMNREFNSAGVLTNTPRDRQVIFMDSTFNAKYDVEILASAFNMSKADFMGRLFLIDNFTTFDNDRWRVIREESDGLEEITAQELALMADVHAVVADENFFQVYDNLSKFTEKYVSAGVYWNYFYHTWKTVATSPFSNAVAFVESSANIAPPDTLTVNIVGKDIREEAITIALQADFEGNSLGARNVLYLQDETSVTNGIGITPNGAVLIPASAFAQDVTITAHIGETGYKATTAFTSASNVGDSITLNKDDSVVILTAKSQTTTAKVAKK